MKRIALSLIVALGLAACEEEGSPSLVCGKKDPLNELPWLKQEMSHLLGGPTLNAVVLYIYEGREVLELQGSVFSSTNQHQYYCEDRKSTRLNSSHVKISYAVLCLTTKMRNRQQKTKSKPFWRPTSCV